MSSSSVQQTPQFTGGKDDEGVGYGDNVDGGEVRTSGGIKALIQRTEKNHLAHLQPQKKKAAPLTPIRQNLVKEKTVTKTHQVLEEKVDEAKMTGKGDLVLVGR